MHSMETEFKSLVWEAWARLMFLWKARIPRNDVTHAVPLMTADVVLQDGNEGLVDHTWHLLGPSKGGENTC